MNNINQKEGLPSNAKLVFTGEIFEVWQWDQQMFDGTMATFERIWRPPTVIVIATVGDKLLIEEQDQPDRKNTINLVAGRADKNEDMLKEAKRELMEETGYRSDDWQLLFKHDQHGKVLHDVYYFIARDCKKVAEQNLDAGEKIQTKLVDFEDFLKLPDESRFWCTSEFVIYLLRLRMNPAKKEEFRKLLFL